MSDFPPPPPPPAFPPPPSGPPAPSGGYPATLTVNLPEKVGRWRVIGNIILAIPHLIILYVLNIVAQVLGFVAWLLGVFTGSVPEGILNVIAMVLRYQTRVGIFALYLTEEYPPFAFESTAHDPGDYASVRVDFWPQTEGRNRLTIFFRLFMVVPHFIALFFVVIAFYFVLLIAFFAVLILGRWPSGLRDFAVGLHRWSVRLYAYFYLLTDEYPPFGFSE